MYISKLSVSKTQLLNILVEFFFFHDSLINRVQHLKICIYWIYLKQKSFATLWKFYESHKRKKDFPTQYKTVKVYNLEIPVLLITHEIHFVQIYSTTLLSLWKKTFINMFNLAQWWVHEFKNRWKWKLLCTLTMSLTLSTTSAHLTSSECSFKAFSSSSNRHSKMQEIWDTWRHTHEMKQRKIHISSFQFAEVWHLSEEHVRRREVGQYVGAALLQCW